MVMKKGFSPKLKKFLKEILDLLERENLRATIYGSLAYVIHTKKRDFPVNDVDILVPEKYLGRIKDVLEGKKIKHSYNKKWHTVHVFKGKEKIEIDSAEYWYGKIPRGEKRNLGGLNLNVMTLNTLKQIYSIAAKKSKEHSKEYYKKYQDLKGKS